MHARQKLENTILGAMRVGVRARALARRRVARQRQVSIRVTRALSGGPNPYVIVYSI